MTTVPHGPGAGNRLVVFAPNWLGDAVMALPAIADVVRGAGGASVVVAARRSVASLFPLVSGVDGVIDAGVEALTAGGFDRAILLPNSFKSALVAWRAGIRERAGYDTDWRGRLLTRRIPVGPRGHQAAYYQYLTSALGYPSGPSAPQIDVAPALKQGGRERLTAAGWNGVAPLVAFAPGAANGIAKQWPPESYAQVARQLAADGVAVVLVGAASDAPAGRAIRACLRNSGSERDGLIDLIGKTDLPGLAGVLVNCRALVCNDSGAMHFAAALGIPVTAMFGPSRDKETRPLGRAAATVLTASVWCRPCMLKECPLDHRCMTGIAPDTVLAATRPLL